MLLGLADDAPTYGPAMEDGSLFTQSTDQSTITLYPPTIKAAPRAASTPGASVLDVILPKKVGAGGKITIWGLPPAAAYALVAVILGGAGLVAYQHLRGGRRVANGRRRRGAPRGKRARYKR